MIVVTGAAGFIASFFVQKLNQEGYEDVVLVDDFSITSKKANWENLAFTQKIDRGQFFSWLEENEKQIQFVFHLGARTDTTEFDNAVLDELNLNYSRQLWRLCVKYGFPLVYASSAATYGMGEHGYEDKHEVVKKLNPLNPYGVSKNEFDKWALSEEKQPYFWAGLKLFNVYGPNENHKRRMASVVWHTFNQVIETEAMKLFRSHHSDYKDGEQLRDFIYVKDVAEVLYFLMHHRKDSGLYNLGTGQARTFLDLATATFSAMGKEPNISFIDTPVDIREKYQYFTEANMDKLRAIGYDAEFTSLEEGVKDYVQGYLMKG
ncbi:MAG: ADP-glyceromanno-heptose 6-epimerase [Flavobacteriales bacterium]|nr:ADP-glyceromanno-heptose 6-epimerase [Flavobacteriales bacterium]|tara:strand:+ start:4471 stop:5427 length:957 start_codon:yes stop_codon:yes gene_type:complete